MGKPKAPASPNPQAVASSQTASNLDTAKAQAQLNNVNQVDAYGNKLTYTSTPGEGGIPQYTQTQTLAPKVQGIYDAGIGTQQNLSNLAQQKSGELGGLLNAPLDFSAQKDYLNGLTSGALDKSWDRNSASLDTKLSNQGIKIGSDAYTRAQNDFDVNRSDAYNSANVGNYNTALQSQLALRQQPINELLALSGQSQIQQPQFGSTPQTGVSGTDIGGITGQNYSSNLSKYGSDLGQWNSTMGGLFGLGSSALMAFSDSRLKTNIEKTGEKIAGVPVVEWDWKDGSGHDRGVIAQALEKKHPELVDNSHPSGYKRVSYGGLMALGAKGGK